MGPKGPEAARRVLARASESSCEKDPTRPTEISGGPSGPTHTLRGDFKHFEDVVGVPACDPPPHRDTFFVIDLLEEADREAF